MAVIRTSFPAVLEALLRARGPGVVCDFKTTFGFRVRAQLLRLETRHDGSVGLARGLCAILRQPGDSGWTIEVLQVADLAEVSCEGPVGWSEALPW